MKGSSKKKIRRISGCISKLCGELGAVREEEERRRDRFPPALRDSERFERVRFTCDVLEEAESNLDEARDNLQSVLSVSYTHLTLPTN